MELGEDFLYPICSLTAWSGVTAGLGGALLSGKQIFNITFVAANTSFKKSALIGGGAIGAAAITFFTTLFFFELTHKRDRDSTTKYMRDWSWTAFIPVIAIPYFSGVSMATGITLVALGALGAIAKGCTVGIIS